MKIEIGEEVDFKIVNDILINNTEKSRLNRGIAYYKDGYVEDVSYNKQDRILVIDGQVSSEYKSIVYNSNLVIDLENKKIISGKCNCHDCMTRSKTNKLAICKHIVAITINVINLLKTDIISNLKQTTSIVKSKQSLTINKSYINRELLSYFKKNQTERVNLDIKVELLENSTLACDFKIGIDKMYVIKDIKEFAYSRVYNNDIVYGMDFLYNPISSYFGEEDEKLVEIIEEYGMELSKKSSTSELRYLYVRGSKIKRLMKSLEYKNFEFKYKNLYYYPKIIKGNLPISFDLKYHDGEVVLKSENKLPVPISPKGDVVFYDGDIYILDDESGMYYNKMYKVLMEYNEIFFNKEEVSEVLSNLVPKLNNICDYVKIDKEIEENICEELVVKYYFDIENNNIVCDIVFHYDGEEYGKFVIRDEAKEQDAIYRIYSNYFDKINNKYVFKGNDAQLFDFLSREINRLKNIGEVYYSDKLKEKKIYNSTNIKIGLGEEINQYLDFSFKIDGVDEAEYKKIIDALKANKRFYKLGNGSFINLEETESKEILKLMESLGLSPDDKNMKIHTSKALYINDLLTEKKLPYIEGVESIKEIVEKFRNRNNIKIEVPKDLNANLRDYQLEGLSWFETIDYCGFGGILSDEMGLGKTIQTIGFLLTKKGKKSLVITPTSLIHNWKNEFEKFAPTLNIGIVHGAKREREKIIGNYQNYDILLTTYGSLRNDLEIYEKISFDYCIIDEAQNIKNPTAMSTDAVKAINAKTRYALTGTPIENNLQELWSIFDFVMPGYLYNLNKFSAIFIRYNEHTELLKRMIKPFILRRTKRQVIKELPDKIEKQYFVELGKNQRKVYGVYVDDIQNKLKEKKEIKDKITIFAYLTKLRQLCLDPSVIVKDYKGKSAKTDACIEIIKEYTEINNKILVFSQFTSVLKNIGNKLDKNKIQYLYLDGQTKALDRIKLVDEFNNGNEKKVFLISLKAGGTGLNLTSANTVIHFDPWWNPSVENQASDRAHRFGQKEVVEVIKLIAKGTIEEKIVALQESKKKLIDDMIDSNLSDSKALKSISDEELLKLFK